MTVLDKIKCNSVNEIVSNFYNVNLQDKTRKIGIMLPKQITQYFLRKKYNLTYQSISDYFNLKQHGTAMSNIKRITDSIPYDKFVSEDLNQIELIINESSTYKKDRFSKSQLNYVLKIQQILEVKNFNQLKKIHSNLLSL